MLIKLFRQGQNSAAGPIDYLLDEKDSLGNVRTPNPEILRGDSVITARLIDSLDFEYKYNSGVLSFAPEDQPPREKLLELIDSFEEYAFAGLESDRHNSLWVLHRHTGNNRIELHFLMPRVELDTGKSLNAFPPGFHYYFNPWRDWWNFKEGWASPSDPERARDLQPQYSAFLAHKKILPPTEKQEIHDYLMACIEAGLVKDRSDLVSILKNELGLEINRLGKDYLSIRDPQTNKKIRFKGFIYNESWRIDQEDSGKTRGTEDERARERSRILAEFESGMRENFTKRALFNQSYYRVKGQDNEGENRGDGELVYRFTPETPQGEKDAPNCPLSLNLDPLFDDDSCEPTVEFETRPTEDPNQPIESILRDTYHKISGLEDERVRQSFFERTDQIINRIRGANEANSARSSDVEETKRISSNTGNDINEASRRIAEINRIISEQHFRDLAIKTKKEKKASQQRELSRQKELIKQHYEALESVQERSGKLLEKDKEVAVEKAEVNFIYSDLATIEVSDYPDLDTIEVSDYPDIDTIELPEPVKRSQLER